jgi:hypothetical protein
LAASVLRYLKLTPLLVDAEAIEQELLDAEPTADSP